MGDMADMAIDYALNQWMDDSLGYDNQDIFYKQTNKYKKSMAKAINTTIQAISHVEGNRYRVQAEDNTDYVMTISAKKYPTPPVNGDYITIWDNDGTFNYGGLGDPKYKKKSGSGGGSSDGYWKDKYAYETESRDPKIELQTWAEMATSVACAAIANGVPLRDGMSNGATIANTSGDDIMGWIYEKAENVYRHINQNS